MIYAENKQYTLIQDDMLKMGDYIPDGSIDAVITDPHYELGFMGKSWDKSGIAFQKDTWKKCFNALKDGGYLLAFGGTRTFHRIACAIEDAGFEIRDTIMYLYGSGFPKSLNIGLAVDKLNGVESEVIGRFKGCGTAGINSAGNQTFIAKNQYDDGTHDIKQAQNQWSGWGTALKPAYEPIIVARKPMKTSVAENVLKNRVGGINIDECRVGTETIISNGGRKNNMAGDFRDEKGAGMFAGGKPNLGLEHTGRFPANIIHDGSEEVIKGFPESSSNGGNADYSFGNQDNTTHLYTNIKSGNHFEDSGNASRFFYTAKASKKDRDEGLDAFGLLTVDDGREKSIDNAFQRGKTLRKNTHPTVKPIELMQYLIKMVTPKGGTILDCFMGSGSTGKAVMFENREREANYKFIGIELTEEYLPICKARIEYAMNKYEYDEKMEREKTGQLSLFEMMEEAR